MTDKKIRDLTPNYWVKGRVPHQLVKPEGFDSGGNPVPAVYSGRYNVLIDPDTITGIGEIPAGKIKRGVFYVGETMYLGFTNNAEEMHHAVALCRNSKKFHERLWLRRGEIQANVDFENRRVMQEQNAVSKQANKRW